MTNRAGRIILELLVQTPEALGIENRLCKTPSHLAARALIAGPESGSSVKRPARRAKIVWSAFGTARRVVVSGKSHGKAGDCGNPIIGGGMAKRKRGSAMLCRAK